MLEPVVRTSGDGLERLGLGGVKRLLDFGQDHTNAVAAVPSIHAAHALLVPLLFSDAPPMVRAAFALYPLAMGATLVVTAEHYAVEVALGFAYMFAAHALTAGRIGSASKSPSRNWCCPATNVPKPAV